MNKTKIIISVLLVAIILIAVSAIYTENAKALTSGSTVRAFVVKYIGANVYPNDPFNSIEVVSYGFYQDKAGLSDIEEFYAISIVNLNTPVATSINADIVTGIINNAESKGYTLARTDVLIIPYQKGN